MGTGLSTLQWAQARLPSRLNGLGLGDPQLLAPVARMSAMLFYCARADIIGNAGPAAPRDFHRVRETLSTYLGPAFKPLAGWADLRTVTYNRLDPEPHHLKQHWWAGVLYEGLVTQLQSMGSMWDQARLACQQAPHSSAWLTAPPVPALGLKFGSREYRLLLGWWLGVPLLAEDTSASRCPQCGDSVDIYGDHAVSCRRNGPWLRHRALQDTLQAMLVGSGIAARREVSVGSKDRPADIYLPSFAGSGPVAIDFTIRHPTIPSVPINPASASKVVERHEEAKKERYTAMCADAGCTFVPWGMSTWGGFGPEALKLLQRLTVHMVGDKSGSLKAKRV